MGDGELSGSSSCKTVSHLLPVNTVFVTESMKILVVILRHFSDIWRTDRWHRKGREMKEVESTIRSPLPRQSGRLPGWSGE